MFGNQVVDQDASVSKGDNDDYGVDSDDCW